MQARHLVFGVFATGLAGTVVIGWLLSGAVGEIAAVGSAFGDAADRAPRIALRLSEPAPAPGAARPLPAAALPETQAFLEAPDPAVDESPLDEEAPGFDEAPLFAENEFLLDYFGDALSLNDLGQLATPDPAFEREIRSLANEFGEIPEPD